MIRTIARKGFRFVGDVSGALAHAARSRRKRARRHSASASATGLPQLHSPPAVPSPTTPRCPPLDRPAIAVLPFTNISGEPEQEYFSEGISEDIITALSKLRWFYVIARNSSFVYKGKSVHLSRSARSSASAMSSRARCARTATMSASPRS